MPGSLQDQAQTEFDNRAPEDEDDMAPIDKMVFGGLWDHPGLSSRERSLITITAALCTQDIEKFEISPALLQKKWWSDLEIAEICKHLAYYLDEALLNSFLPQLKSLLAENGA